MKNLEKLTDALFSPLSSEYMLAIRGGLSTETRKTIWTPHGGHEDNDGYDSDEHEVIATE